MRIAFGALACILWTVLFCPAAAGGAQAPLSQAAVEGRLRLAMQVAREKNDRALMRRVEDAVRQVRAAL